MNKTKYQDSETVVEENASTSRHLHHGKRKCNGNKGLNYSFSGNVCFLGTKGNFPTVRKVD